jgi:hypothetical protein
MQPQPVRQDQKSRVSDIATCINPDCAQKFLRLGEGYLTAYDVSDPVAWGLPPYAKQKVVWICEECSRLYFIRLDRRHHTVSLVHRRSKSRAA